MEYGGVQIPLQRSPMAGERLVEWPEPDYAGTSDSTRTDAIETVENEPVLSLPDMSDPQSPTLLEGAADSASRPELPQPERADPLVFHVARLLQGVGRFVSERMQPVMDTTVTVDARPPHVSVERGQPYSAPEDRFTVTSARPPEKDPIQAYIDRLSVGEATISPLTLHVALSLEDIVQAINKAMPDPDALTVEGYVDEEAVDDAEAAARQRTERRRALDAERMLHHMGELAVRAHAIFNAHTAMGASAGGSSDLGNQAREITLRRVGQSGQYRVFEDYRGVPEGDSPDDTTTKDD